MTFAYEGTQPHPDVAVELIESRRCIAGREVVSPAADHRIDLRDRLAQIAVTRPTWGQLLHALLHSLHARRRRPALEEINALAFILPDLARHAFVQVTAEKVEALLAIGQLELSRLVWM